RPSELDGRVDGLVHRLHGLPRVAGHHPGAHGAAHLGVHLVAGLAGVAVVGASTGGERPEGERSGGHGGEDLGLGAHLWSPIDLSEVTVGLRCADGVQIPWRWHGTWSRCLACAVGTMEGEQRPSRRRRRPEPGCAMANTILIVEDELKIRELLRGYFEREGFAVVTTGSGAEAITLAGS